MWVDPAFAYLNHGKTKKSNMKNKRGHGFDILENKLTKYINYLWGLLNKKKSVSFSLSQRYHCFPYHSPFLLGCNYIFLCRALRLHSTSQGWLPRKSWKSDSYHTGWAGCHIRCVLWLVPAKIYSCSDIKSRQQHQASSVCPPWYFPRPIMFAKALILLTSITICCWELYR